MMELNHNKILAIQGYPQRGLSKGGVIFALWKLVVDDLTCQLNEIGVYAQGSGNDKELMQRTLRLIENGVN